MLAREIVFSKTKITKMKIKAAFLTRSFNCLGLFLTILSTTAHVYAGSSITAITTTDVTAAAALLRPGVAASAGGPFDVTYNGVERRISTFVANGVTYQPIAGGAAVARRNNGTTNFPLVNPNQTAAWNQVISTSSNASTVSGTYQNTMDGLFSSNNIRAGTENLFINTSTTSGDVVNNVERMDYIFSGGITVGATRAFSVFERGQGTGGTGVNGGFKVAAITSLDNAGVPNGFSSTVVSVADNSYNNGGVGVTVAANYDVFRFATNAGPELDLMNNTNIGPQGVAGFSMLTTEFATAGTTIFGYAVFGKDVTVTGNALVDWTNTTNYVTNSGASNDVDLVSTGAVVYQVVPEPSAVLLGMGGLLGLLVRRRR